MKKKLLLFVLSLLVICQAEAQEVITFVWEGSLSNKSFFVDATPNKNLIVNWGDENITVHNTGEAGYINVQQPTAYGDNIKYTVTITTSEADCSFFGLFVNGQKLTSLDLTQVPELEWLVCSSNAIAELDLSRNIKLDNFICDGNLLTELDLSKNLKLKDLACSNNNLTSLDLSENTNLLTISCYYNRITELNLRGNVKLEWLYCNNNLLTELDVSQNIKLDFFDCRSNLLTTLNLSQNVELEYLYCNDNLLTNLDFSQNSKLFWLECYNNSLTELNIKQNTSLAMLSCYNNVLTELDLSRNTSLGILSCYNNRLLLSDLYIASQQIPMYDSKQLGTQELLPQTIQPNQPLSLLGEMTLGGINTVFSVLKNGNPTTAGSDYELNYQNQTITFLTDGNYTVKLTNEAIYSHANYPAQMIISVVVSDQVAINDIKQPLLKIYPNPVHDVLHIESEEVIFKIEIIDLSGRVHHLVDCNSTNFSLDMNGYSKGIWLLNIKFETERKEIIKIVKL